MIRAYCQDDRQAWDAYVRGSSETSCYHLSRWKEVIEQSFNHRCPYLLSEDGAGAINGILPLVQLKSALFGNFAVSLPYFNYGGACADSEEARRELLAAAVEHAASCRAKHIELRHSRPLDIGWRVKNSKVVMLLSLPQRAEQLWRDFPSKLRSQIQKPIKEGMYARLGREDSLEDFYRIFSVNMRDLGTPVYSKEFFRNILRSFPSSSWIFTIGTPERRPVAAAFLLGFKNTLELPWASSLRAFNRHGPNMLLYWSVLKFACDRGFGMFDFGRSTPGEGTYRFKEQWGAKPVPLYWYYWMNKMKDLPELNPRNPKYRMAIHLWKRLPVGLTRLIGPAIVKNLP